MWKTGGREGEKERRGDNRREDRGGRKNLLVTKTKDGVIEVFRGCTTANFDAESTLLFVNTFTLNVQRFGFSNKIRLQYQTFVFVI